MSYGHLLINYTLKIAIGNLENVHLDHFITVPCEPPTPLLGTRNTRTSTELCHNFTNTKFYISK